MNEGVLKMPHEVMICHRVDGTAIALCRCGWESIRSSEDSVSAWARGHISSKVVCSYDPEARALYIDAGIPSEITRTLDAGHGVNIDIDEFGNLLGVEVLFNE